MKLQKCWLSTGMMAALLATLVAHVKADEGTSSSSSPNVVNTESRPKLDASLFERDVPSSERHQYGAEVSRLLKIFANSVYTDKKAVVRELLSNAIDAIKKQHDLQLVKAGAGGDLDDISNYKIIVEVDKDNGILSITDNGIGMTHDELKSFLGTIAKSGTAEFVSGAKKGANDSANMIGQFGVGFYSGFLVAKEIVVVSKSEKDPKQWIWETDASASFSIAEDPKGNTLGRGTRVMLKIKSDSSEYLDVGKLESIMKEYFGYDRHRIYIVKPKTITEEVPDEEATKEEEKKEEEKADDNVEVEEDKKETKPKTKKVEKTIIEEILISQNTKPIWQRNPSDVTPAEYEALYKTVTGDKHGKPIAYTHFIGETSKSESFRAVLFIPERPPFSPFNQNEQKLDLKLHVRGVFVTAKFDDFIPKHLSFVKGVIDSDDLSLNISREILQNSAELRGIRKKIIRKIIEMMENLSEDKDKYKKFYDAYSSFIKMDISEREDNRSLLAKLLRYKSTKAESRSLEEYIEAMPEAQKKNKVIYYLAGQAEEVGKSPFVGRFKEKGFEVLLMTEPVDEHTITRLEKYDDFKFENIAKDGIKLDDDDDKEMKEYEEKYKAAKSWVEKSLKGGIEKVVFVSGPASNYGSLKSSQFGWTGNMERLIMAQSSSKEDPMLSFFSKQKKILELNPKNRVVQEILERANEGKVDKEVAVILRTIVDGMTINSGYALRDASSFMQGIDRMTRLMLKLSVDPLISEAEEKDKKSDSEEVDASLDSFDAESMISKDIEEKTKKYGKPEGSKGEVAKDEKKIDVEESKATDKDEL